MFAKEKMKMIKILSLIVINTLILSACASEAFSKTLDDPKVEPEVIYIEDKETEPVSDEEVLPIEEPHVLTHEEARDIAISYLVEKFELDSPGEWAVIDQTPENLLGSSAYGYTSGAWVAFVEAPVVAPEYLVYSVEIDQISLGMRWTGEVNAKGDLQEDSLIGPMQVLSVTDARDAAVLFVIDQYGWDLDGEWIEQSVKPTENAGVRYTFTAGPWVVQVEFLAAAPIVPEYRIIADNLTLVERWEGFVKANGEISEELFLEN